VHVLWRRKRHHADCGHERETQETRTQHDASMLRDWRNGDN
jgi:hypothetical protein